MTELLTDKVVVRSGVGPGLGRALGEQAALMGAGLVLASLAVHRHWQRADAHPTRMLTQEEI